MTTPTSLDMRLNAFLDPLEAQGRYRRLRDVGPSNNGHTMIAGREVINFSSNNYLGLAGHPLLIERSCQWTNQWGCGATASRLVCGSFDLHRQVEEKLAKAKGSEAALIFNSGFQANSAILSALFDKEVLGAEALVFTDRLNHASMHHGCKAAGVRQIRFRHNDMDHLEDQLQRHKDKAGHRFIITETVFSMDGDRCELDHLIDISNRYGATLYVDEAHATGILGQNGFGMAAHRPVELVMGTFSKALGGFGAYLCCSKAVKEFLINRCAGFIYSTALPPSVLGAMDAALDLIPTMEDQRTRLLAMADKVRLSFQQSGLDTGPSSTQIIPAIIGDETKTLEFSKAIEKQGILAIAIRPPTVPAGTSRIRFALSAIHNDCDIDHLCQVVRDCSEKLGLQS